MRGQTPTSIARPTRPARTVPWHQKALLLAAMWCAGCTDMVGPRIVPPEDMGRAPDLADDAGEPVSDMPTADTAPEDMAPDLPVELRADPGPAIGADIGAFVTLDGSASSGAVAYQWDFGDGNGWAEPRATPVASTAYAAAGRYEAALTVFDELGARHTASTVVTVTHPVVHVPRQSSTVLSFGADRAAVVSTDSGEVLVVERSGGRFDVVERMMVDRAPRTVASWREGQWLVVPCRDDATVIFARTNRTGEQRRVFLPVASQPYGAVEVNDRIYVTLQATGEVVEIEDRNGVPTVTRTVPVIDDARDIAVLPDGRLAVSRWRSPAAGGEIAVVAADLSSVDVVHLQVAEPASPSPTVGGLPSYLGALAVSPTGREAAVPSLQANTAQGLFRSGQPLTYATTFRAVASFLELPAAQEAFGRRTQWDGRGLANAAAFSPRGDFMYVAMRGNRSVERYDMLSSSPAGALLDVGYAVEGIAVSADGRWLFADAALSRELVVYDLAEFGASAAAPQRIPIPSADPLDPEVLRGKQLFNDAADPRLGKDGYIACAHCHLEGDSDRLVWDFTDRGEGLRNTIALTGRGGLGHGALHWSASFDEVQDFEHDIREAFGGTGLMSDGDFSAGTRGEPLGEPKAAISPELDALARYVTSLDRFARSPFREESGQLSAQAQQGEQIFLSLGCGTCHAGVPFTDSTAGAAPLLHDVGTLGPGSGQRQGAPLVGLDTPTLRGLWSSAPYLHDGSAATLEEVLTTRNPNGAHGDTASLDSAQLAALVEYLRSLDDR